MEIFFGWLIFSIVVGIIGSNRKIGFWGAFFLSLLLSPILGLIIVLVSKSKEDEQYRQEVLKTQEAQKVALEKLSDEKTIKESSISIADELEKLQKLKEKKVINETEYSKLKNKLIESLDISLIKQNYNTKTESITKNTDLVDINVEYEIIKEFYYWDIFKGKVKEYLISFNNGEIEKSIIFNPRKRKFGFFSRNKWLYFDDKKECIIEFYKFLKRKQTSNKP